MRLIGRQVCGDCGHTQWACYMTDGDVVAGCECAKCGEMTAQPEGLQIPAALIAPDALATVILGDMLDAREHRLVTRVRES